IGIERLRSPDIDEQRATAAGCCGYRRHQVCFGILERLIRAVADSDDDETILAQMDNCRFSIDAMGSELRHRLHGSTPDARGRRPATSPARHRGSTTLHTRTASGMDGHV